MRSCDQFQTLLLDKLYDLLEPADAQALEAHLAGCPACAAALNRAREQQRLLAAAARSEFPTLRFEAPRPGTPVRLRRPARSEPAARNWGRWAVAACIWLVVGALGVVGSGWYLKGAWEENRVAQAKADRDRLVAEEKALIEGHVAKLERAAREWDAVAKKITDLEAQQRQELEKAEKAVKESQMYVSIVGPQRIEPGATNEFRIETNNLNNNPVPARITARVLDQHDKVVYQEKDVLSEGKYKLALPRDLQLKPDTQLSLEVVAHADGDRQAQLRERLSLGKAVYVTHLATDKPMYQPGETVHFRSLTLERFSLKPPAEELHLVYSLVLPSKEERLVQHGSARVSDLQGKLINGPDGKPLRGVGAGQFVLPPNFSGGEYILRVREVQDRFPPQERKFTVNRYQKPRIHKELEFTRKSFGPGEEVGVAFKASLAHAGQGGSPLIGKRVSATVVVDGKQYDKDGKEVRDAGKGEIIGQTDAAGGAMLRFKLPAKIERGEASVAVTIAEEGGPETLVKPIPVVIKKLEVEFFPEGGDLVAGVPNRVYFQVRTPLGKPADLKGRIVDPDGQTVATIETLTDEHNPGVNQGMGLFEFTPKVGTVYELKIDAPTGIEGKHLLPNVTAEGVVMRIPSGLTSDREPIHVLVRGTGRDRRLLVGAYCRGRLLDHGRVEVRQGEEKTVELRPSAGIGGVYRVTVFEERANTEGRQELVPVAERLVYRLAAGRLNLTIKPDKKEYLPRDKVTLSLTATNEKGQPQPAVLMVAVVDKSVLNLADEKTARSMPTHFFLTSEVRRPEDLEHADFLLSDHPLAPKALDLLLGTQGWRRFAEQDPKGFQREHKHEAERLLVTIGQMIRPEIGKQEPINPIQQALDKVAARFTPQFRQLQEELVQAQDRLNAARQDGQFVVEKERLDREIASSEKAYLLAVRSLEDFRRRDHELRSRGLLVLAAVLLLVGVVSLLIGLVRRLERSLPYLATGVCSMALCALVLIGTFADIESESTPASAVAELRAPHEQLERYKTNEEEDLAQKVRRFDYSATVEKDRQKWEAGGIGGASPPKPLPRPTALTGMLDLQAPPAKDGANFGVDPTGQLDTRKETRKERRDDGRGAGPGRSPDGESFPQAGNDLLPLLDRQPGRKQSTNLARRDEAERLLKSLGDAQARYRQTWEEAQRRAQAIREGKKMERSARETTPAGKAMPPGPMAAGYFNRPYLPPPPPCVVREYAHVRIPGSNPNERSDFAETLYWHPVVVLPNGEAQVAFQLCDSVTTFQIAAAGHTGDGRLGATTTLLESRLPFTVDPKLPIEVTRTDVIDVPVTIANDTDSQRTVDVRVEPHHFALISGSGADRLMLGPNQRDRRFFRFQPTIHAGEAHLVFRGLSEPFATDDVRRGIRVVPEGFPVVGSCSDLLEQAAQHRVTLPAKWVDGTLRCQVQVFPSVLSDLQSGLEGLLREPNGCFEQTSTSNYPNLLILDYLKTNNQARPEVARRAMEYLERGYARLLSFECKNPENNNRLEGFEWFGGNTVPHEALTAYGLMQFRDMSRVFSVNPEMLERTRKFLMSRKDNNGGFRRKQDHHSFGRVPDAIYNAYIVWALTEGSQEDDVQRELAALEQQAKTSTDPYFLGLVANSLINRGKEAEATEVLRKLARAQQTDGHLDGAQTSITLSGGRDLQIETTALATLAWEKLNRPEFIKNAQDAVTWLGRQRGGYGGFGSTQATILTLKALLLHTQRNQQSAEKGELALKVNGKKVAQTEFKAGATDVLTLALEGAEQHFRPGVNDVVVEMTGKNRFPYTLTWSYSAITPESAAKPPLHLRTELNRARPGEEERVQLAVTVQNQSGQGQGMAVAIVGLPAGLGLPEDMKQLKELTEAGKISYFELRGRELILYWRGLAKDQKVELSLDLIGRVPGKYRGPASRAYLYYNADHKHWVEPLEVEVVRKED